MSYFQSYCAIHVKSKCVGRKLDRNMEAVLIALNFSIEFVCVSTMLLLFLSCDTVLLFSFSVPTAAGRSGCSAEKNP